MPRFTSLFWQKALLLVLLSLAQRETVWAATAIQFTLVQDYLIVVRLPFGEAGSFEFLLDTGANTTLVTPEFAQKLGLQAIDRIELITIAGTKAIPRTKLKHLTLGNKTIRDVEALVSDLQAVRSLRPNISGVLGQNVLTQFNYLVNFQHQRLMIEDGTELESKLCGVPIPMEFHEGRAMLRLANNWRLVLDSGIAMLSLFDPAAKQKELVFDETQWRAMKATSDLGSRTAWQGQLPSFTIAGIPFRNLPVALFEINAKAEGRVEDGLLPLRLFTTLYFNHRQNYLVLNPQFANQSPTPTARPVPR